MGITYSPHAFVPKTEYTEEEKKKLYQTRVNESYRPYTVIDVLTKVYHRSFRNDLSSYIGEHPTEFQKNCNKNWAVSDIFVSECRVIRPESIFNQLLKNYYVDIVVAAKISLEEVVPGHDYMRRKYPVKVTVRMRYCFDLRPCHLSCRFEKVVTDETESLLHDACAIPVDKYLLPVLRNSDYEELADYIFKAYYPEIYGKDVPIDPWLWLNGMNCTVRRGVFPEEGVLGEYFFGFGNAVLVDPGTGETEESNVDPGTIVVNHQILKTPGSFHSTLAHEGSHKFFATPYYMLQKTHGHDYCSYMCKRRDSSEASSEAHEKWNPVDIMEMHANKFPAYLLIPAKTGKEHAERLLRSYGGKSSLENMERLVSDMAEFYGTTKTMARTRLIEFGYGEVRGIMQSVNGSLIPSYVSNLKDSETYTVDETDGLKEYTRNPAFREIINSGRYRYVEGHYCLTDRKYVFSDQFGAAHLTHYARENMAECCLVFRCVYENAVSRIINGVLRKGAGKGRRDIRYVGPNGESPVTEEGRKLRAMIEQQMAESGMLQMSFNQMTVELMKQKKMTIRKLADETGISEETISNMRNDPAKVFSIREIVAVALAMHLSPETSELYIKAGPSKFLSDADMMLYQYALHQWYMLPVDVVNRRLVEAGAKPLTSFVDGYDENGVRLA